MKCPKCKSELRKVGHVKDFYQRYKCSNGCEFEKPLSWEIQDLLGMTFAIIVALVVALLAIPCYILKVLFNDC